MVSLVSIIYFILKRFKVIFNKLVISKLSENINILYCTNKSMVFSSLISIEK